MKKQKLACQKVKVCNIANPNLEVLVPVSDSRDKLKDYRINQILECDIKGEIDARSLRQLGLYWTLCGKVALNSGFPRDKDVDEYVKLKAGYVEKRYDQNGNVTIKTKSISYENMKQKSFNKFMNAATGIMADFLGVSEEDLLNSQHDVE